MHTFWMQTKTELRISLRNGEQLLVSLVIPLGLLLFFATVPVLPLPENATSRINFLAPGIFALAVMSSSFVSLGIATGFDRHYGVLKLIGSTPLGKTRLFAAKIATVFLLQLFQFIVLIPTALLLGWNIHSRFLLGFIATLLGTAAFSGFALVLAGRLTGLLNLATINGLYILLLLFGGMIVPLTSLPSGLASLAKVLPSGAFTQVIQATFGESTLTLGGWIPLILWAITLPLLATKIFQWE